MKIQTYNLPDCNSGNTFAGVTFILPTDEKYDLTDATVKIQIRKGSDSSVIKEFKSPTTLLVELPHTIIFPEQLITIGAGTYFWDLKIVFADGRQKTYIGGQWKINPVITQ